MADNKATPTMSLRGRKGSAKDSSTVAISDIPALIRESEERIKSHFKDELKAITDRLDRFEQHLSSVQTECARLDSEVSTLKELLISQQMQIEGHESRMRENNIIVHNIPENDTPVLLGSDRLTNDLQKTMAFIKTADIDIYPEDIVTVRRIGKRKSKNSRPLKITLKKSDLRFKFLNNRMSISKNSDLIHLFNNRIYVNNDSSFLVRKEELRLRQVLKKLKDDNPNAQSYIRSGVLYHEGKVVDKIDIKNQLF